MAGDKSRDIHPCFHNGPLTAIWEAVYQKLSWSCGSLGRVIVTSRKKVGKILLFLRRFIQHRSYSSGPNFKSLRRRNVSFRHLSRNIARQTFLYAVIDGNRKPCDFFVLMRMLQMASVWELRDYVRQIWICIGRLNDTVIF